MLARLDRLLFAGPDGGTHTAAAAVVAFACCGLLLSLAVAGTLPVLAGEDEVAHLGYVSELSEGRLPHIDTQAPEGGPFPVIDRYYAAAELGRADAAGNKGDIWVANHPPLGHLVAVPFTRLAAALGWGEGPVMVMRALNGVAFALGAIAVAAVAHGLAPGRRRAAVAATALAALAPNVLGIAAQAHVDGFAFLVASALLAVALRVLRSGPSTGRLVALVGLASAAALTRAALLPLVLLAAGAWLVTCGAGRETRRQAWWAAAVLAAPLLAAGWFYARNVDLYGDIAASGYLQRRFGRERNGSTLGVLVEPRFLVGVWQGLWGSITKYATVGSGRRVNGQAAADLGTSLVPGVLLVLAAVPGWAGAAVDRWRVRVVSRRGAAAWGLAVTWLAVTALATASFVAGGGTPHPRYLFPALAVITTVLALGLSRPVWRGRSAAAPVLGALVAFDLLLLTRVGRTPLLDGGSPFAEAFGPPGAAPVVVVVLAVAAAVAAGMGLRNLAATPA